MGTRNMTAEEFREQGFLRELNRCFLHPLGLALEVVVDDDGTERFDGVWDDRDDPEGIVFADGICETEQGRLQAEAIDRLRVEKTAVRQKRFGWSVQPVAGETERKRAPIAQQQDNTLTLRGTVLVERYYQLCVEPYFKVVTVQQIEYLLDAVEVGKPVWLACGTSTGCRRVALPPILETAIELVDVKIKGSTISVPFAVIERIAKHVYELLHRDPTLSPEKKEIRGVEFGATERLTCLHLVTIDPEKQRTHYVTTSQPIVAAQLIFAERPPALLQAETLGLLTSAKLNKPAHKREQASEAKR